MTCSKGLCFLSLCLVFFNVSCQKKAQDALETLHIALTSPPKTLDPRRATDANGQYITHLLFHSLVRIGPDLKPINEAANHWTYNNLTYTFHLHKGLTFSNGAFVTKEDLLFTFEQYTQKGPFQTALNFIKDVKVKTAPEGHLIVQIFLSRFHAPLSFFSDLSVVKILPKAIVLKYGDDFFKHLIGSGSFVLEKQSSSEIILKARKNHPIATPKIQKVVFKIIKNEGTLYFKALKEEFDIIQSEMPHRKVKEFENHKKFQVFKTPGLKVSYLLLNLKHPVLSSQAVRKAIATALNRDEIIEFKLSGLATPATSLLTPNNPFFYDGLKPLPYDLVSAQKTFKPLKADQPILIKTSHHPSSVEVGRVIAHQIDQAGLDVQLQSFEWATYYGDVQAGRFHIALMKWVGVISPDIYKTAFHSLEVPPKGRNRGFYQNEELDKLLELGPAISSFERRKQLYQKVQERIMADLPIIPLWYNKEVSIIHKRVKNYQPSLNGDFTSLLYAHK